MPKYICRHNYEPNKTRTVIADYIMHDNTHYYFKDTAGTVDILSMSEWTITQALVDINRTTIKPYAIHNIEGNNTFIINARKHIVKGEQIVLYGDNGVRFDYDLKLFKVYKIDEEIEADTTTCSD